MGVSSNSGFIFGQSGASLEVRTSQGKAEVFKSVKSDQSSARLQKQYKKHLSAFENGSLEPLIPPKPTSSFRGGGYSMEYVHGTPLGSLLQVGSRSQFGYIADVVGSYFERHYDSSKTQFDRASALQKLDQLETGLSAIGGMTEFFGRKSLSQLKSFFQHSTIKASWNHGDLSLENLIFQPESSTLFALDLLDSPFDAIEIDMGRLWLDVDGGWWGAGTQPSATTRANLIEFRSGIEKCFKSLGVGVEVVEAFATLAALRILPYTSNPVRKAFVQNSLARYLG